MKPHRWLIALASRLVPRGLRPAWRDEWNAELHHREATLNKWRALTARDRGRLLRESLGALWDALWLQSSRWQSLRFLAKHGRLTAAAVVSLGAAMAVTIAALGIYNALLLRPPGVQAPRDLLTLYVGAPSNPFDMVSTSDYRYYRDHNRSFSSVLAFPFGITWNLTDNAQARVTGMAVSDNYFDVLGVRPLMGRLTFPPRGDRDVIVLSEALWRRLGADPNIVGQTVRVGVKTDARVIGVVPATFAGMALVWRPDEWFPLTEPGQTSSAPAPEDRTVRWLNLVGRLKPGVTAAQAQADVVRLSEQIAAEYPKTDAGRRAFLTPTTIIPAPNRSSAAPIVGVIVVIASLTLIAACTNVTNLLLGLAMARRHEMLVRVALGATRVQLMVPLLREGLLLGTIAGGLGVGAADAGLIALSRFTVSLGPDIPPASFDFHPDLTVAALAVVVTVLVGLAIGLVPAWRAASDGLAGGLHRASAVGGTRRARLRHALIVVQISVATVVLVGVGLALRNVENYRHADLGFSARNLVIAEMDLSVGGYTEVTGRALYDRVRAGLAALPGVQAVSLASGMPIEDCCEHDRARPDDARAGGDDAGVDVPYAVVDESYFSTIGLARVAGRTFDGHDAPNHPETIVINRTMARRFWPTGDPIGQRVRIKNGDRIVQVVGVVADAKYESVDEDPTLFMYFALKQHYRDHGQVAVIVRTAGSASAFASPVREGLRRLTPDVTPLWIRVFEDDLRVARLVPNLTLASVGGLGVLALLLTFVGLYSTVFYSVSQRQAEIGIRVALGAQPRHLFGLVFHQTAILALIGYAVGIGISQAGRPIVAAVLYGVRPVEIGVLAAVLIVNVLLAVGIAYLAVKPWTRLSAMEIVRRRN